MDRANSAASACAKLCKGSTKPKFAQACTGMLELSWPGLLDGSRGPMRPNDKAEIAKPGRARPQIKSPLPACAMFRRNKDGSVSPL